jgi:hypothetical protein
MVNQGLQFGSLRGEQRPALDMLHVYRNMLVQKIATDRNPSVTMMNLVEELLAPDDVRA